MALGPERPSESGEQIGKPFMTLRELGNRLKGYPALQSMFLRTLNDQEWEEIVLGRSLVPETPAVSKAASPIEELMDKLGVSRMDKHDFELAEYEAPDQIR